MKFVLKPRGIHVSGQTCSDYDLLLREGKNEERVAIISGVRWRQGRRRTWTVSMIGFYYQKQHPTLGAARKDAETVFTRWMAGKRVA